jgi:iron complex outermembrane receptor protein
VQPLASFDAKGFFVRRRKKVKKVVSILIVCFVLTNFVCAYGEEKPSILGRSLDRALSPLEIILTPSQRLDPIVVTPSRYSEPSLNASKNITVITEEQIKKSHARYVPDLLRKEAGILVSDFLGNGKTIRIDMRGFGDSAISNLLVLVDGRRTNQIDLSGADWTQIDVGAIEKIEITRGPQTVLYGDNATGGVINIITKSGKDKKPELGIRYERGSYRYSSFKAYIEGGSNFLDYFGMVSTSYNNGYRINNYLETVDYNTKITLKPADYFNLRFSMGYHRDWYGLPGAVKPVDINSIGRRGSIYPENKARTDDYYFMLTPEMKYDFGFGETFFSTDFLMRTRRTNSNNPTWVMARANHIKTLGATPKLAFTTDFLGIDNRMIVGVDYYANTDEINDGWLAAMDTITIDKDTLGLYIADTVELPFSVILNGGFRGEWAYYKFAQHAQLEGLNRKEPFEYAYEAGLTYKYNERSSIYATHSRSFRFPVTDEWYQSMYTDWLTGRIAGGLNLDLKPQVGHNYEIGIKENSSKYIELKADYYVADIKNELYYDSVTNKNSVHHHTIHHGLELETSVYLLDAIHAFANYAYTKAFFVGDNFAGNEIPQVPRHKFSTGFNYAYMDAFNFNYTFNFVDKRYFINDLKNEMPKLKFYTRHDARISYSIYGLEVFAAVNNIFDEEYSEYGVLDRALVNPGYYPSPRRNFLIGTSYKF